MNRGAKRNLTWFLIAIFWLAIIYLIATSRGATPTPTPFAIGDSELQKISRSEIVATVKHLVALSKEQQQTIADQKDHLANAAVSQTNALNAQTQSLSAMTALQREIDSLATHDKAVTDKLNKAEKSLWWYRLHWWGAWIMLGVGILLCVILGIAKLAGKFFL